MKRKTLYAIAALGFIQLVWLPTAGHAQRSSVQLKTSQGLHVGTFETPKGTITVYLPDDMAAGDTISGTVTTKPAGNTDAERSANSLELHGYVVEFEKQKIPVTQQVARLSVAPASSIQAVNIFLRDSRGREVASTAIPIYLRSSMPPRPVRPAPTDYTIPSLGQTGRPIEITGPFDGDLSNTQVQMGSQDIQMLAESPRKLVVSSPTDSTGQKDLTVRENGVAVTNPFRNVGVNLTAPKTTLMRGERTTLTVLVEGLAGIQQDLPLQLASQGTVHMDGGETQTTTIRPQDVQSGGTFTLTRELTGTLAGGFAVTAEVGPQAPILCTLAGQTVHVEGDPTGGTGLWVISIKGPSGEVTKVFVNSQEKPKLKFCNWINISSCHDSKYGNTYVDTYALTENPNKKPPTKAAPPRPEVPVVPVEPPRTGGDTGAPLPCKEGDEQNKSDAVATDYEYVDGDSDITVQVYTDIDGAINAARNMADFWKAAAKVVKILEKAVPGGAGKTPVSLLIEYLKQGGDIVDAVADGPLAQMPGTITVQVTITTTKVTVTSWTVEVCRNGTWVKESRCEVSKPTKGSYPASQTLTVGTNDWLDKVANDEAPRKLDPKKVNKWASDFLEEQLTILNGKENDYKTALEKCKK